MSVVNYSGVNKNTRQVVDVVLRGSHSTLENKVVCEIGRRPNLSYSKVDKNSRQVVDVVLRRSHSTLEIR